MDYKNTVEGKEVQKKYRDILYSSRPEIPPGHTRMDINNRAKIFSPFAALRGYEDEIRSEGRDHLKGSRIELADEEQGKLSEQLQKVTKGMRVIIRYFKEGFYVTKDNAINFLEEKLSIIGLNYKERNEFIMYWLPILEKNKKSLVYFELTNSRQNYNRLIINPKPDSLLRVAIHVKKVNQKTSIKEEKLPRFERKGFTAVEWGGVIHK